MRIWQLARAVANCHDITLLSLCQTQAELGAAVPTDGVFKAVHRVHLPRWRSWAQALFGMLGKAPLQVAYYRSRAFRQLVDELLPSHDMVWCHLARMAPYAAGARLPRWLEMTDTISLTLDRASRVDTSALGLRRLAYRIESGRMARYEQQSVQVFDLVSLISNVDRRAAFPGDVTTGARVVVAPNGVEMPEVSSPPLKDRRPDVALIGRMDSLANRDALTYFTEDVWPQVRLRVPEACLHVIGLVPPSDARRLERQAGVVVEGVVPKLWSVLQHCRVGVCPVRFGAGMQNKVLDCLAHGLATVTSPIGLEGLQAQPDRDLVVASTTPEWVDQVSRLLQDDATATALALAGQALVGEHYRWEATLSPALQALDDLWSIATLKE